MLSKVQPQTGSGRLGRLGAACTCGLSSSVCVRGLEDHLAAPRGRGRLRECPIRGAGGAPCGDLITIRVVVEGDRVADAGFDASGCGAAQAAGSAVVELVAARRSSTPPASPPRTSRPSSAGCRPARSTPRRSPPMRCTPAIGARRSRGRATAEPRPELHARRHERRRGQRGGRARRPRRGPRRGRGDARAVGGPAGRRRALVLLAGVGRERARARALARTCRTSRSTCATRSSRTSSTTSWPSTPPAARPTRACAATASCASTACSTWRRARRRAARHGPLRAHRARRGRPAHQRGRGRRTRTSPTCSRGSTRRSSTACGSRSPSSTSRPCAGWRPRPSSSVAEKPESQDLCFLAGVQATDLLRRRGLNAAPRRDRRHEWPRKWAPMTDTTSSRSASARASESAARSRST